MGKISEKTGLLFFAAILVFVSGCLGGQTGYSNGNTPTTIATITGDTSAPSTVTPATTATTETDAVVAKTIELVVSSSPSLGSFLVDQDGKTLYVFTVDTPEKSNCNGQCAAIWPPFTATYSPVAGEGVSGVVGMIQRSDGSRQVTYDGRPLYYYYKDLEPGQTNGQGVNGVWFVATPSGQVPTTTTSTTQKVSPTTVKKTTTTVASGGYSYGGYY